MNKKRYKKSQVLKGVKVIDFAEVWAGPFGASLMGDMGADVIKVESYPRRSLTRPIKVDARVADGPGPTYERTSPQIQGNRNKRNIALDIKSKAGIKIFKKMIEHADIIIEGFAAGVIEKLGFSWDEVHKINDKISMISMPAWGVEGPYKGYTGLGSGIEGTTGHAAVRGLKEKDMIHLPGNFMTDATAPIQVVFASMTALMQRQKTSKGSFIDMSQSEAFAWHLVGPLGEWTLNNREPEKNGNNDQYIVPHNVFKTKDQKWIVIAAENDLQWEGLSNALEQPAWIQIEHQWSTINKRINDRQNVDSAIQKIIDEKNSDEIVSIIQENGAIASPIVDAVGMFSNLQMQSREWFQAIEMPYLGERLLPGFLWKIQPDQPIYDYRTGMVGEHNEEILLELGFQEKQINNFYEENIIGNKYAEE